jgi:hypothetical protein
VLNGKTSPSQSISAGVPQGSVIGPLLFVIYVNDVKHNILSSIKLFADDTALIKEINNPVNDFRELNNDLETLNSWSKQWLITFNADKTKYLIFSINLTNLPILPLSSQALEFRTPLFPHLVPPAIMVWIFVWKYIFEPVIHILQHFMLQLSRSTIFCF